MSQLRSATMAAVRAFFSTTPHRPSEAQWAALDDLAGCLASMAEGTAPRQFFLSSVDPGVGKTETLRAFLKCLLGSEYRDAGAVVCLGRKSEIKALMERLQVGMPDGVPFEDVAVLTTDPALNGLSPTAPDDAPLLFTTQQMVDARCRTPRVPAEGPSFEAQSEFHYRGRPRRVRAWDEEAHVGTAITLGRYDIAALMAPLAAGGLHKLAERVSSLFVELSSTSDEVFKMPDLGGEYNVTLNHIMRAVHRAPAKVQSAAALLWMLSDKEVRLNRDSNLKREQNTLVSYEDTLPADLAPMVILDASGRVRGTYSEWEASRGTLTRLKTASKRYDNLRMHVWQTSGGKRAYTDDTKLLAKGIMRTIQTKMDEPWLLIHHKADRGYDMEAEVCALLGGQVAFEAPGEHEKKLPPLRHIITPGGTKVYTLPYGEHMATNRYSKVRRVILAGCLYYAPAVYEALGRMSSGTKAPLSYAPPRVERIVTGEFKHHVLQAACRGAVRCSEGDGCPATDVYLIASVRGGVGEILSGPDGIFPGCQYDDWCPVDVPPKGKLRAAVTLFSAMAASGKPIKFQDFAAALGMRTAHFKERILSEPSFGEVISRSSYFVGTRGTSTKPNVFLKITPKDCSKEFAGLDA